MREIKFRVWDARNNRYRKECNERLFFVSGPGETSLGRFEFIGAELFKKNGHEQEFVSEYNNEKQLILEQFTGLKDKNGKEIYEGDIVKACLSEKDEDINFEEAKDIGRINYRSDTAGYSICYTLFDSPFRLDISVLFLRGGTSKRLEIIGNIHENPELLK